VAASGPDAAAARDAADAAGTWPPLDATLPDDELLTYPRPPADLPPFKAARLLRRRWVTLDSDGLPLDETEGEGVVGEFPRIVAGSGGPHFTYSSRTTMPGDLLMPGTVVGSMDGAFEFECEPVRGGDPIRVWARVPRMVLRVPEFRF
jgi:uncharacterized protein affecting Mg2+/Co2+ transport